MIEKGTKVKLMNGGNKYPLFGFYDGKTYIVSDKVKNKDIHDLYKDDVPLYIIESSSGNDTGYAYHYQLEIVLNDDSHLLDSI